MQQGFFRASGMAEGLYSPHHEGGGKLSAQFSREWISSGEREWVTFEKRRSLQRSNPVLSRPLQVEVRPLDNSRSTIQGLVFRQSEELAVPARSYFGDHQAHEDYIIMVRSSKYTLYDNHE